MRPLLVALVLLFAVSASADPSKDDRKKANAHFKQGKAFYEAAQWQSAIDEYEKAWALVPEPLLQFNIGLAYEHQGNLEEALARYQHYLELDPSGPVADEAREDVATLTPKVEAIRAERDRLAAEEAARVQAEKEAAEKAERDRQERERIAAEEAERKRQEAEQARREAAARAAAHDRAASRARLFTWSGYGVGAIGVAGLALGVTFGLEARADDAALTGHTSGPWTQELIDRQAHGETANRNMMIFTIAGGAAVVGGGVLWFLGHRSHAEAERLSVAVTGDGILVAGRF